MTRYAEKTKVPVSRSKAELEALITRFGATSFMSGMNGETAVIAFEAHGRRVVFRMQMPEPKPANAQETRRRWRALTTTIKAKLVSVVDGIETFEEAFMAHVMMPDGLTVGEHVGPRIAQTYETQAMQPLLPPPTAL